MKTKHVNYDSLAPTYNQRYIHSTNQGVKDALLTLAGEILSERGQLRVLEAGCGTGRWLADLLAWQPAARLAGLDFSTGMLRQAQLRQLGLPLVRGRAEYLPFPSQSFDLVYCINALHHFDDRPRFVSEAHRLLEKGGALAVIGLSAHEVNHWFVYEYFEGTLETDLARFPTWQAVAGWMRQAGFNTIERRPAEVIMDTLEGDHVLDHPFLQKNSCSQLALLSDEAYATGIQRIQDSLVAAHQRGESLFFQNEIHLDMLIGR